MKNNIKNLYAVTIDMETVNEFTDSLGNIIPAGTKQKFTSVVIGVKGIQELINAHMMIDKYILNEVKFTPIKFQNNVCHEAF